MKFATVLLPLISLASGIIASPIDASVLEPRAGAAKAVTFTISSFYNYGRPHSGTAFLNFDIESSTSNFKATCSVNQNNNIATAPFYTRCNKAGVGFGFEAIAGGYLLTIAHKYNKNKNTDVASLFIPNEAVKRSNNLSDPNGNFDYIDYPEYFYLSANSFVLGAVHGPVRDV